MGAMKHLMMDQLDQMDAAKRIAHDMGALDRCEIHEEYINPYFDNDDFLPNSLGQVSSQTYEAIKKLGAASRAELMKLFEEAIYQADYCHSCEKNASE